MKHLKVAKFALEQEEMVQIKGGSGQASSGLNCPCHFTENSGCIDGTGSDCQQVGA